jgi:hypothetical protein
VQGGNGSRLDPGHAGPALGGRGHAGQQPAAADGDQDGVDLPVGLLKQFQAERSLPGADLRLVVGVAEQRPGTGGALARDIYLLHRKRPAALVTDIITVITRLHPRQAPPEPGPPPRG